MSDIANIENFEIRKMAAGQWVLAPEDQKAVIRFGMIPKELLDEQIAVIGQHEDHHRLLALALFECAQHDGGMRS